MDTSKLSDELNWQMISTLLPSDINETAYSSKTLIRCRNVLDATDLLHMFFTYSVLDISFKDAAASISASRSSKITGPSLFYRFKRSGGWLKLLLAQLLQSTIHTAPTGMRLRIVDAAVITGPGATGTEYRAHVLYDPFQAKITIPNDDDCA